jgi:hypothetical protein
LFPDWPAEKAAAWRLIRERLRAESLSAAPVAAEIPSMVLNEGTAVLLVAPDGTTQSLELQPHEVSAEILRSEVVSAGPQALLDTVSTLGRALGEELNKTVFTTLDRVSEEHGGKFGGDSPEEMLEEVIAGLEQMNMQFDDDGRPSIFFVAHPDALEKFRYLDTPEAMARLNPVLERKKHDWLLRESRRKLAD